MALPRGAEEIIGRDAELERIRRFIEAIPDGFAALVLEGEPGIGKTILWKQAVAESRDKSHRVLSCQPAQAETRLAFAGLTDLLGAFLDEALPALPEPQALALEVALLRTQPKALPPDWRAVSVAFLGAVRYVAGSNPVLIAVDDVQWLDRPSARILEFSCRRLEGEPVGILLTSRGRDGGAAPLGLARVLPEHRLDRMRIGPVTVAALHQLFRSRLGVSFPRPTLVRMHEVSGGNPFFALELARSLHRSGKDPTGGEPLPVPDTLRQLVRDRLARLPARTREALLAVASLSQPTVELIRRTLASGAGAMVDLEKAVQAGVVELEGERIRFIHPLLASVHYSGTPMAKRREMHRRLAAVIEDPEERARHLALSAQDPDADVAEALDEAARSARARGAPDAAAELSEQACRVTPPERAEELWRRILATADSEFVAGDTARAGRLLEGLAAKMPPGTQRARVFLDLGRIQYYEGSAPSAVMLGERALAEVGDDAVLRCQIEQALSWRWAMQGDIRVSVEHAHAAATLAESIDDATLRAGALSALGYFGFFLGEGLSTDVMDRALALEGRTNQLLIDELPSCCLSVIMKYVDRFDTARMQMEALWRQALDRGEEGSLPILLYHLSELESWTGNWDRAEYLAGQGYEAAEQTGQTPRFEPALLYAVGLVEALRGRVGAAQKAAEQGKARAQASGWLMFEIRNASVLGFLELSAGNAAEAHRHLGPLPGLVASMGVQEPGVLRFLPDEIEALASLGELERAQALLEPFEERAHALDRPWALATGARCRGLLGVAKGDVPGAFAALEKALVEHERLLMPFELARTLLVQGQVQRRARQKRLAKESLEQALQIFERLGATLWAERARGELRRVGLRPSAPLELTETEQRVADLAATGRTNREIAEALFVTPKTVEANLARVYHKLGVRSKAELAARVARGRPGARS